MRKRRDRAYTEELLESFTRNKYVNDSTENVEDNKGNECDAAETKKPRFERSRFTASECT